MTQNALKRGRRAMTARANSLTAGATLTVPATQLRLFVDAFDRLGFDAATLLRRAGLERAALDDPDATTPCATMGLVIGAACEERRMPNLGAHLAVATPIGAYPLLDYLVVTSDSVGRALEQLAHYWHLAQAPVTLTVAAEPGLARLVVQPGTDRFMAEYETAIAVHHLRAETEQRLNPVCVHLMHTPDDVDDLRQLLRCPVRAPSTWSGVEFSAESLRLPLRRRDPVLRRLLEGQAAEGPVGEMGGAAGSSVARVRVVLASGLPRGAPSMVAVARQLGMAPRTLQRHLAAEGFTYQSLVDRVRREAAERLLVDRSLGVAEIGYLLGFSEPSAFHRAFKRWHRITPREYRRRSR